MTAHEQYQLLVGEIGTPRGDYLYELPFWEILLITRGYWRRFHPGWEQARLIAHQVHYCMGVPKGETAKGVEEWIPFSWEKSPDVTEENVQDILEKIREENRKNGFT